MTTMTSKVSRFHRLHEPKESTIKSPDFVGGTSKVKLQQELLADHKIAIKKIISEYSERAMEAIDLQICALQRKSAELEGQEMARKTQPQGQEANPIVKVQAPARYDANSPDAIMPEGSPEPLVVGSPSDNDDKSKSDEGPDSKGLVSMMPKKGRNSKKKLKFGYSAERLDEKEKRDEPCTLGKGVFADAETMKVQLRKALAKPAYDVASFYKEEGWCQMLARSSAIENMTLGVIGFNAIWLAVDIDYNDASMIVDADPIFQVVDNFFCLYFVAEISVRFGAFAVKKNCLKDAWFVFDAFMAISMALETWLLTLIVIMFSIRSGESTGDASLLKVFRLFRLVRMARVIRLLSAMPELMVVIKGLAVATRAVSCTVLLMLLVIYVFAIFFRQVTDGTHLGKTYFKNVPLTMRFLLLHGTMADLADPAVVFFDESFWYALMFLFFILMVTITIMNMLVGVLVGVVSTVSNVEQEQLVVTFVKENLLSVLRSIQSSDHLRDGTISREEFSVMLHSPEAIRAFNMLGVDVLGLVDLSEFIFHGGDELEFVEFIDLCLQLRGSNQATVKDIVDLRKFIFMELKFLTGMTDLTVDAMDRYASGNDEAAVGASSSMTSFKCAPMGPIPESNGKSEDYKQLVAVEDVKPKSPNSKFKVMQEQESLLAGEEGAVADAPMDTRVSHVNGTEQRDPARRFKKKEKKKSFEQKPLVDQKPLAE